jgi:hypothetical protein
MRNDLDIPFPGQTATMTEPFGRTGYGTRQGGLDPNTKRMAIIAGGIGGAFLVLVGVWSAVAPRRAGIPVIEADLRPVRERPVNKGGLNVVGADESSLGGEAEGKAVVAPSPEAPALAALKATPPSTVAEASKPQVIEAAKSATPDPAKATVTASPKEVPPVALGSAAKPPMTAAVSAQGSAMQPVQRVAVAPTAPAPVANGPGAASPLAPATAAAPSTLHPTGPVGAAPASPGAAQVQLAAVGSEPAAQAEWARLTKKFPDLLGTRHLAVSHVDRDGKTYWRVRTGGFADAASATAFCGQLKAKGAACSVASF